MLEISRQTTVRGQSKIDGVTAVSMTATITVDGEPANINRTVTNHTLYNDNKEECRQDYDDFVRQVHDIEDEMEEE